MPNRCSGKGSLCFHRSSLNTMKQHGVEWEKQNSERWIMSSWGMSIVSIATERHLRCGGVCTHLCQDRKTDYCRDNEMVLWVTALTLQAWFTQVQCPDPQWKEITDPWKPSSDLHLHFGTCLSTYARVHVLVHTRTPIINQLYFSILRFQVIF